MSHSCSASYLWTLEGSVECQARPEACQCFDVGGGRQWSSALGEDGERQRFQMLGIDVPLVILHWL